MVIFHIYVNVYQSTPTQNQLGPSCDLSKNGYSFEEVNVHSENAWLPNYFKCSICLPTVRGWGSQNGTFRLGVYSIIPEYVCVYVCIQIGIKWLVVYTSILLSGWWFETFYIFPYIGNNNPI